jgi:hypothetical protein
VSRKYPTTGIRPTAEELSGRRRAAEKIGGRAAADFLGFFLYF